MVIIVMVYCVAEHDHNERNFPSLFRSTPHQDHFASSQYAFAEALPCVCCSPVFDGNLSSESR